MFIAALKLCFFKFKDSALVQSRSFYVFPDFLPRRLFFGVHRYLTPKTQNPGWKPPAFVGQVLVPVMKAAGGSFRATVPLRPTEQVPQGHVAMSPCKDASLSSPQLQLAHDGHHLGPIRGRQRTALLQDSRQLLRGQLLKVQLQEAVAEGPGEYLKEDSVRPFATL